MSDIDALSGLGAAFTPQDLLLARRAAERQGLDAANSPYNSGLQAAAKSAGLALGSGLARMGGGPLDQLAERNQAVLAPQVDQNGNPTGAASPGGPVAPPANGG